MKILIAIKACHRYRERAQSQRETWVPDVPAAAAATGYEVDVRWFLGRSPKPYTPRADEVALDVDDSYNGLPEKSRAIKRWAVEQGYDFVLCCDDDTYVVPSRLLASGFQHHDYVGRLRGPSGKYPAPYASGFAYWLSARACRLLADAPIEGHLAEDRWAGNELLKAGIECHLDDRYVVVRSVRNAASFLEAPRDGNEVIAACEFEPKIMHRVHEQWKRGERTQFEMQRILSEGPFSRVCVLIKTFLRDGFLFRTVQDIQKHLPGMKMIIVDDGYESREKIKLYADLRRRGHFCVWLPFDSGFGAKANAGMPYMDREYVLIGSDDFDFAGREVPDGIRRMISVLDARGDIAVVAGRVDNNPYEGFIERGADYFREIRFDPAVHPMERTPDGVEYALVDLTVNYNLVRSKVLGPGRVVWETHNKIGGDHFDFYEEMRKRGYKIAWAPGVNIRQMRGVHPLNHRKYGEYRARARQAIPGFLRKHGIRRYIGFDGRVDKLPEEKPAPVVAAAP